MGNLDFVYLLSPFSDANSRRFYRRDFGHNKQVNSGDYDKSAHNFSAWFHSQLATNLNFSSSSFRSMLYRRPSCSGCSATYSISFEQQQLKNYCNICCCSRLLPAQRCLAGKLKYRALNSETHSHADARLLHIAALAQIRNIAKFKISLCPGKYENNGLLRV